jgi:protein TonB
MSAQALAIDFAPRGLAAFQKLYRKYASWALAISVALHFALIGLYFLVLYLQEEEEPIYTVRILKYSDLGPPPSIANADAAPQVAISAPAARPSVGIPVPVPDAEVSPEQTIATQTELSTIQSPVLGNEGDGTNSQLQIEPEEIKIQEDLEPADFVAYEKGPEPVNKPQPTYPEIALKAGMEGTVWVKVWVDKEGKPKKVTILKSDAEIFNEAAVEAAWKWVFTPAMMNNGPVAVNVTIPFRFKLK